MVSVEIDAPVRGKHGGGRSGSVSSTLTGTTYYARLSPWEKLLRDIRIVFATIYAYRRIIFLLVSSFIAIVAAVLIGTLLAKIDHNLTQESYYDCLFKESAYVSQDENCNQKSELFREALGVFVLQVYMMSFGFLPFFAFSNFSPIQIVTSVVCSVGTVLSAIFGRLCCKASNSNRRSTFDDGSRSPDEEDGYSMAGLGSLISSLTCGSKYTPNDDKDDKVSRDNRDSG
jgi:ABC-type multidrug transport system fused ATPase/permease subunit